jgi:methylthioribose-1-phosphate isomerase
MKSSQRNSAGLPAGRPGPRGCPVDPPQAAGQTQIMSVPTLQWLDPPRGPAVALLDQTRLPTEEKVVTCENVPELVDAIRRLVIRGAPALGVAGAFGVALAACRGDDVAAAARLLAEARPTAVNLGWGTRRALAAYQAALGRTAEPKHQDQDPQRLAAGAALDEARAIAADDATASAAMARHGLALIPEGARVLTHCNTGSLVSAGGGTAFAVIMAAHRAGRLIRLYVDETRPLLQGARLTAYEAQRAGIDYAVLADSAAGGLLASGAVDVVLTGADRIAADGSVANKVGTYSLAVLAQYHRVPFVVVAPVSTIDFGTASGGAIVVEHRAAQEVTTLGGQVLAPAGSAAYNPAFDVTPASLVSALVTERGITQPVTTGNLRLLNTRPPQRKSAPADVSMEL